MRVRRGFTLIETLLSGVILSVIIVLLFNLFPTSMLSLRRGEHTLKATALARTLLESKRAGPFSALDTAPALDPQTGDDGTVYTPSYTSTDEGSRLRRIRVTVDWLENGAHRNLAKELWVCDLRL